MAQADLPGVQNARVPISTDILMTGEEGGEEEETAAVGTGMEMKEKKGN